MKTKRKNLGLSLQELAALAALPDRAKHVLRGELLRILLDEELTYANRRRLSGIARTLRVSAEDDRDFYDLILTCKSS